MAVKLCNLSAGQILNTPPQCQMLAPFFFWLTDFVALKQCIRRKNYFCSSVFTFLESFSILKWENLNCVPYLDLEEMREERGREGFSDEGKQSCGDHRGNLALENLCVCCCSSWCPPLPGGGEQILRVQANVGAPRSCAGKVIVAATVG